MRSMEIWHVKGWKYMTLEYGVGWNTRLRCYMLHILETQFKIPKTEARKILDRAEEEGSTNVKQR